MSEQPPSEEFIRPPADYDKRHSLFDYLTGHFGLTDEEANDYIEEIEKLGAQKAAAKTQGSETSEA